MSKLEDRIKAIMEGKKDLSDKSKDAEFGKDAKKEETSKGDKSEDKKTSKESKKLFGKETDNDADDKDGKDFGTGTPNKKEVKEAVIPGQSVDFKGDFTSGKSGSEDNNKGHLNGKKGAPSDSSVDATQALLKNKESASAADPAAGKDNEKIQKDRKGSVEKTGKLQAESFSELFAGEELSEEFISKAETIFEASVAFAVEQKVAELHEEYQSQLDEAIEEAKGELVEQIDEYLDAIVEMWIENNSVALESGIKVELANSFIDGIKRTFQEHYVEIPEDKVDVVEEQALQIAELQAQLEESQAVAVSAFAESQTLKCEEVIASLSEGLTAMQCEKFASLVENVEFESVEEFASKAKIVRESFFKSDSQTQSQDVTKSITEEVSHSSSMADAVLKTLNKGTLKFVR
jgi:hypothetical protein